MVMDFSLYLITDRKLFADDDSFFAAIEAALRGGLRAVQLREKDLPTRELLAMAHGMRALASKYGAKLFINDRTDVALCSGADGVHLGQACIPAYAARKIAGDRLLIGVSTHSLQEADIAEKEGADFITFGPLYQTPSKAKYGSPVGLAALNKVTEQIGIPVFGIGGIRPDSVNEVMECGVRGIAVISGILGASDIAAEAKNYLNTLEKR
ncbi:MAG: thiamine phosphate synthase [Nitrospirae bacterium]|nr:thiamine phosphate synthase [Nitrospirota bacterium]